MPKIKAIIRVENANKIEEFKTNVIIQDNFLKYKEKDNTTMIIDTKNNILVRENNNIKIEIPFSKNNKTIGRINLKEMNKVLNVEVKTNKIEKENNNIEINYEIEKQKFIYNMEEIK